MHLVGASYPLFQALWWYGGAIGMNSQAEPRRSKWHSLILSSRLLIYFPFCPQKTGAYSISKMALLGLTQTLAVELASKNIWVNFLVPGIINTDCSQIVRTKGSSWTLPHCPIAVFPRQDLSQRDPRSQTWSLSSSPTHLDSGPQLWDLAASAHNTGEWVSILGFWFFKGGAGNVPPPASPLSRVMLPQGHVHGVAPNVTASVWVTMTYYCSLL